MAEAPRRARLALVLLLAATALPVAFVSPALPPLDGDEITAEPLATPAVSERLGPFRLAGAWRLTADNTAFSGFSALAFQPDGRLFALTDRGAFAQLPVPGAIGRTRIGQILPGVLGREMTGDTEALVVDRASGRFWVAIEFGNIIQRFDAIGDEGVRVKPAAMRDWPLNSGAETLVRLADGRFVAVAETVSRGSQGTHRAVLFEGDPADGAAERMFHLAMPDGFAPVDAALLPDGRVLLLGRKFALPYRFESIICIADPAQIRWGGVWQAREVARLAHGPLTDNYEGMAIAPADRADGRIAVWLISDDNGARLLQATLLLKLEVAAEALPDRWAPD